MGNHGGGVEFTFWPCGPGVTTERYEGGFQVSPLAQMFEDWVLTR